MLIINDLALAYGPKLLFTDVNLNLNSPCIYGLVGANGAGKSSFLKVLSGDEEPCMGEVIYPKHAKVGILKQDQFRFENTSIINTVIAGKKELWDAICEKESLLESGIEDDKSGYRLGELEQIIFDNEGYTAEYIASELLFGLGIEEKYHHQPLKVLSGGFKLRVLLAQSLFNNPDILLLDEPTNHLDIGSIIWLEKYLKTEYKGLLILISHDIAFMNNLADYILDVDYGEIRSYRGNYDSFVKQKEEVIQQKLHELQYKEKYRARIERFVERFKAGTRSKQAKSREKELDKLELPDIEKSSRVSPTIRFVSKRACGKNIIKIEGLSKTFGDKQVLRNIDLNIYKGEKVVIIGPNGVGKSTLLKIVLGEIKADSGSYTWGFEGKPSYFSQDHHDMLKDDTTVLAWMRGKMTELPESKIRGILGQLLFRQDDAYKNILKLSGGEGARLLLAKIVLEENHTIILDEPTNHLDIESKDALKKALVDYTGTVVMVTHDRDFASSVATRIIAITSKKVTDFRGSYTEYLEKFGVDYFK
jgi:ATPase subunit of ABC transporter with duplicated ATPase domains